MSFFKHLMVVAGVLLWMAPFGLQARTRKGDRYLAEGRIAEGKKQWDSALEQYQKALAEDPAEIVYQIAVNRARFQAAQAHVDQGIKVRAQGQLGPALLEFQRAFAIDPSSQVAQQELEITRQMIERERKRVEATGKPSPAEERGLTPAEEAQQEATKRIERMLPVPELRPPNRDLINITIHNQPVKVLFETIGKMAGINVLWDPDYQVTVRNNLNVDFNNATPEQALDYLAVLTKSYWKPLSANTIFVTNDNPQKRRDYAEMVAKTFYLSNINTPQELQEIVNVVRSVAELQRVFAYTSQNAIVVRGEADQVAYAEKIIRDLDKPRAEVVVDILVLEASSVFSRQLTTALASTGLNVPVNFTPRNSISVTTTGSNSTSDNSSTSNVSSTVTSNKGTAIPLSNLSHLSTADFSIVLPSALLQAALSDTKTRVMQAPQVRSIDNVKAVLKIGEREPVATGSFQSGVAGIAVNSLVNTQFQYIDVGVNVEITPRVNDAGDISMHVDLDISNVTGHVNLGGIDQPIIGQRKISHDIRLHEGEVSLLGGLINQQDTKQITGIPGLSSIPVLRRFFSGESVDHQRDELMIALIPHIVRRPDITPQNVREIAVGSQSAIRLNYAPEENPASAPQPEARAPAATPPAAPPATAPPAAALPPSGSAVPLASNAQVVFHPTAVETNSGASFAVILSIENATNAAEATIQLRYDSTLLRLNNATQGDLLGRDGKQPVFTKNIQNDSGEAAITIVRPPGELGISGSGALVTLTFQAIGKGSTSVDIPNLMLRDPQGRPISPVRAVLPVVIR